MRLFNNGKIAALVFVSAFMTATPTLAHRGNDLAISDGMGEQYQEKHSLFFNKKTRIAKDRFGDGFAQKEGLLGSKQAEFSLLGNSMEKKKGILGNSEFEGRTMLGDTFVTKKGIFGRRKTAINLSGSSHMLQSFIGHQGPPQIYAPPAMQSGGMPPLMVPQGSPPVNVNGDAVASPRF